MPPVNRCTKNNDNGHSGKERKRSRKPTSSESPKRRRKRGKEQPKKQHQQQQQHQQQHGPETQTQTLRKENRAWRDGTHADLPKTIRTIREQRVKEDCCIICLCGGGDDGGEPVELFSACCGQPYHAICYLKQLAWAKKSSSSGNTSNANNKCGVCRKPLPQLESGICEPATIPAATTTNRPSFIGGLGGSRNEFFFDWNSSDSSESSSDSSSDSSSSSSSDDDDDDDDDDSDTSSEEDSDDSSSSSSSSSSSFSSSSDSSSSDDDDDTPRYVSRVHAARTPLSDANLERWIQRHERDPGMMVISRRDEIREQDRDYERMIARRDRRLRRLRR